MEIEMFFQLQYVKRDGVRQISEHKQSGIKCSYRSNFTFSPVIHLVFKTEARNDLIHSTYNHQRKR
ncbi:CLUMA_CG007981, isoform A [Clunio marinus]|uniref:CLUMA_CG007981, isoform A n=1 Tax=Clunio marinus TaxID=568069 RepID=A0A1J1I2P9_9DIPT|nr:CLUMA_CG007981, isoform A [Clunio marinus]